MAGASLFLRSLATIGSGLAQGASQRKQQVEQQNIQRKENELNRRAILQRQWLNLLVPIARNFSPESIQAVLPGIQEKIQAGESPPAELISQLQPRAEPPTPPTLSQEAALGNFLRESIAKGTMTPEEASEFARSRGLDIDFTKPQLSETDLLKQQNIRSQIKAREALRKNRALRNKRQEQADFAFQSYEQLKERIQSGEEVPARELNKSASIVKRDLNNQIRSLDSDIRRLEKVPTFDETEEAQNEADILDMIREKKRLRQQLNQIVDFQKSFGKQKKENIEIKKAVKLIINLKRIGLSEEKINQRLRSMVDSGQFTKNEIGEILRQLNKEEIQSKTQQIKQPKAEPAATEQDNLENLSTDELFQLLSK